MTTKKLLLLTMFATVLVVSASPAAYAQTPDGETPAVEVVCDPLRADGVTKGLYGLCIAYCEAQDLDEFPKELGPEAKDPGERLLANYDRKRQPGDPDMPCLVQESLCPCWNTAVCLSEMSCRRFGYQHEVTFVGDWFPQTVCDAVDTCENYVPWLYRDRCVQAGTSYHTHAEVLNRRGGLCYVSFRDDVGRTSKVLTRRLTAETAQICADELNNFDPEDDTTPFVFDCNIR